MPDGGKIVDAHRATSPRRECAEFGDKALAPGRLCADRGRGHGHRHSADVHATRFSSRSSPPRKSARAPASACRWSTASSSRPAASSSSTVDVGEGTTFRIFLPRHVRSRRRGRSARVEAARRRRRSHRSRHDPARRGRGSGARFRGTRAALARLHRARSASGVEALDVVRANRRQIDLIVSDVVMPEMDGPTMFERAAQARPELQGHLRLGLCRGGLRQKPAGGRGFRLHAEAVHAEAAHRGGEGEYGMRGRGKPAFPIQQRRDRGALSPNGVDIFANWRYSGLDGGSSSSLDDRRPRTHRRRPDGNQGSLFASSRRGASTARPQPHCPASRSEHGRECGAAPGPGR